MTGPWTPVTPATTTWDATVADSLAWASAVADPAIRWATASPLTPTADDQDFQLRIRSVPFFYLLGERYHLIEAELPEAAP